MKARSTKIGRPKQLPRKLAEAKAEIQAGDLWGQQASLLLKQALEDKGWGYRQLSEALASMGVCMSAPAINRRVNRGNFTAGFLLMCLKAMGAGLGISAEGSAPEHSAMPKALGKTPKKPEKPMDMLESILGGWGAKKSTD